MRFFSASTFYLLVVAAFIALASAPAVPGDNDIWAHAAVGRWIWENQAAPRQTLFLWSVSAPWFDHSWLSQVVLFHVLDADKGTVVLRAFTALMAALPYLVLWRLWRRHAPIDAFAGFLFLLSAHFSAGRMQPRPELFTALFVTIELSFLAGWSSSPNGEPFRAPANRAWLSFFGIVAMFVLWTNFHGAVAFGLVILAGTAAVDSLQYQANHRSRILFVLTLVAGVATFLNPYGLDYWRGLRPIGGRMFADIVEWMPFWREPAIAFSLLVDQSLLLVLAMLAWVQNPRRRYAQMFWLIFALAAFLVARRNAWLFSLTTLAVIAANRRSLDLQFLLRWLQSTEVRRAFQPDVPSKSGWKARRTSGPKFGMVQKCWNLGNTPVGHVSNVPEELTGTLETCPTGVLPKFHSARDVKAERSWVRVGRFGMVSWILLLFGSAISGLIWSSPGEAVPEGAARYIRENALGGRVFNDYSGSSYLQWRLAGQPALFIDLLNAYQEQHWVNWKEMIGGSPQGLLLFEQQHFDVVVLVGLWRRGSLGDYLQRNDAWITVYDQSEARIWVRSKGG